MLALLFATAVQMVFGELFPKNLAIARPEPVARRLARSTVVVPAAVRPGHPVFDAASNLLLRAVRIEPVHDVEHAATPRDLEAIIDESRASGDLPAELSTLLDRVLDFADRPARAAMIPRPRVATAAGRRAAGRAGRRGWRTGTPATRWSDHDLDDVVGVICLRDVLALPAAELARLRARDVARPADPAAGDAAAARGAGPAARGRRRAGLRGRRVRRPGRGDHHGGRGRGAGRRDRRRARRGRPSPEPQAGDGGWTVSGSMLVDEVERLLERDLPRGGYTTIGGLVMAELGRLPEPGDAVTVALPAPARAETTSAEAAALARDGARGAAPGARPAGAALGPTPVAAADRGPGGAADDRPGPGGRDR